MRRNNMADSDFVVDKDNLEVRTSRILNASRQRVWDAFTLPEQIAKWWGPRKYSMTVDKHDFQVGGAWRFVQTGEDGEQSAFSGVFKEIVPMDKIVDTFEYEPMPGHVLVETALFEDAGDGKTKVTSTAKFANLEDLEGMVGSGMEYGQRESYDRLTELVEKA